jgi:hypothetical protein
VKCAFDGQQNEEHAGYQPAIQPTASRRYAHILEIEDRLASRLPITDYQLPIAERIASLRLSGAEARQLVIGNW